MAIQTLSDQKSELIIEISKLNKEESVQQVKNLVQLLEKSPAKKQSDRLKKIAKPMRKKLDLEELKREQHWNPINREEFDGLVKELDIQESLEQLLADI